MNSEAHKCLTEAKRLFARGDDFYKRAAEAILAAQIADPTLSYAAIARELGRSAEWVRRVVVNATTTEGLAGAGPWGVDTPARSARAARKILRDPEAAREVLRDPEIRRAVREELDRPAREAREGFATAAPAPRPILPWMDAGSRITAANSDLRAALVALRDLELDEDAREMLTAGIARTRSLIDVLEIAVSGELATIDWDAELARLTEEDPNAR